MEAYLKAASSDLARSLHQFWSLSSHFIRRLDGYEVQTRKASTLPEGQKHEWLDQRVRSVLPDQYAAIKHLVAVPSLHLSLFQLPCGLAESLLIKVLTLHEWRRVTEISAQACCRTSWKFPENVLIEATGPK